MSQHDCPRQSTRYRPSADTECGERVAERSIPLVTCEKKLASPRTEERASGDPGPKIDSEVSQPPSGLPFLGTKGDGSECSNGVGAGFGLDGSSDSQHVGPRGPHGHRL